MPQSPILPLRPLPDSSLRELHAAHEIAHAFLTSQSPAEVYDLALARVAPLVGATLGCVYLRDAAEPTVLRLIAAYNWPASYAPYLSEMSVLVGNGPTGTAVAENRAVEVFDVFADPSLEEWWEVARELEFASTVSLPLVFRGEPVGAISLYFHQPEQLDEQDSSLLRLVADQLSAAAEKAHLIADLRQANQRLHEQNVQLEARFLEAEEARRLKNEFLANISHELRTPLTAILGYAYLMREGLSGELQSEQLGAVEKIESAGTRLLALIDDLLELTSLKHGRTTASLEAADAVVLLRAALDAVPMPSGLRVDLEVPDGAVPIHTDPGQVLRILRGLLSNAAKFTPEGSITLRVDEVPSAGRLDRGWIAWEVEDTGIGIPPEHLSTIFEDFRQVDGSATRRFGGTGVGLAIARRLARYLGGDVTARSVAGRGSVFTLLLPVGRSAPVA